MVRTLRSMIEPAAQTQMLYVFPELVHQQPGDIIASDRDGAFALRLLRHENPLSLVERSADSLSGACFMLRGDVMVCRMSSSS